MGKLKIWTNTEFKGHWPVPVGAIVIAKSRKKAAKYLTAALMERGLPGCKPKEMVEMPFMKGIVKILSDGNY